jgi:hypothetical protein
MTQPGTWSVSANGAVPPEAPRSEIMQMHVAYSLVGQSSLGRRQRPRSGSYAPEPNCTSSTPWSSCTPTHEGTRVVMSVEPSQDGS